MGDNRILMNAYYNVRYGHIDLKGTLGTARELREIKHMVRKADRPHLRHILLEMKQGIDRAFWFEGRWLCFER